jgi:hypothetical protein
MAYARYIHVDQSNTHNAKGCDVTYSSFASLRDKTYLRILLFGRKAMKYQGT